MIVDDGYLRNVKRMGWYPKAVVVSLQQPSLVAPWFLCYHEAGHTLAICFGNHRARKEAQSLRPGRDLLQESKQV